MKMMWNLSTIVVNSFNAIIETYQGLDIYNSTNNTELVIHVINAIRTEHPISKILTKESIDVLQNTIFSNEAVREFILEYTNYLAMELQLNNIALIDLLDVMERYINITLTDNIGIDKRLLLAYYIDYNKLKPILENNFWLIALFFTCYYWNKTNIVKMATLLKNG